MKILKTILKNLPVISLLTLEIILFATNYSSGTYFLGWDNLFPEMNFPENFIRSFFSVWQENRGLGLLDGMSFAANLPHYLILFILSLFFPQNVLRYLSFFALHFLGGLGLYYLSLKLLGRASVTKIVAFLASIFYLLNIATIQMFFAPYELFAYHFATLPWMFLLSLKFIEKDSRKNLFFYALASFLTTPQSHVPTVFLIYILALSTLFLNTIFTTKKIKPVLILTAIVLTTNAYWLLPYSYSAIHNSPIIANSKINQMATEDIFLNNKKFGDPTSTVLLLGFGIDFVDAGNEGNSSFMMQSWRSHLAKNVFIYPAVFFFLLSSSGAIIILRKKIKNLYPFVILFLISFLLLGNDIPLLGNFYKLLTNYIPYFSQLFRFAFTKFSLLYVFSLSILLAVSINTLLKTVVKKPKFQLAIGTIFILVTLFYSFPAFTANFLYRNLKVEIPQEYFDLAAFFNQQDKESRILPLPQPSFWGWTHTNWGYRGSGFIWYGLPQATLDGAFYPWSKENENLFWEISQSIYSQNQVQFETVFDKYNISWIILDKNIINPFFNKVTYIDRIQNLILESPKIKKVADFGNISVYSIRNATNYQKYITIYQNPPNVYPKYNWNNYDLASINLGNYISQPNLSDLDNYYYYPFRSLFSGRTFKDIEFKVNSSDRYLEFTTTIPKALAGSTLTLPALEEIPETIEVYLDNQLILLSTDEPTRVNLDYIKEGNLLIRTAKTIGEFSYASQVQDDLLTKYFQNCQNQLPNKVSTNKIEVVKEGFLAENLRLTAFDSVNCLSLEQPNLPHQFSYLFELTVRHLQGKPLNFWLENLSTKRADIETKLTKDREWHTEYFVQPPMEQGGLGYSIHLDNASIGNEPSINEINRVSVHPIPYIFLTNIKIERSSNQYEPNNSRIISVSQPNPAFYRVDLSANDYEPKGNSYLVLSQSFNSGWKAYEVSNWLEKAAPFLFGKQLKNHVLVNNWSNGWLLPTTNEHELIAIIYLPQYIQYLGYLFLFAVPTWIFLKKS